MHPSLLIVVVLCSILFTEVASSQSVTELANVTLTDKSPASKVSVSSNGRYAVFALDSNRLIRVISYPVLYRDTIPVPDSVRLVIPLGVTTKGSILMCKSRATARTCLMAIDHTRSTWQDLSHVLPPIDAVAGNLQLGKGDVVAAPTRSTVVIIGAYAQDSTPSRLIYRSVVVVDSTYAVIRMLDSMWIGGVTPAAETYFVVQPDQGSSMWRCVYVSASTGVLMDTVRCRKGYWRPTGIDHIMYTQTALGDVEDVPAQLFDRYEQVVGCITSPNWFCLTRRVGDSSFVEVKDVVSRSRVRVCQGGYAVAIDDAERTVAVLSSYPTRLSVYKLSGMEGQEGLACARSIDDTVIFTRVTYGGVYLGSSRPANVTATIGGKPYSFSDGSNGREIICEQTGDSDFSVVATDSNGHMIDSVALLPLRIRYPGSIATAKRFRHGVVDLSLSADERSMSIRSDAASTMVRLSDGVVPTMDSVLEIPIQGNIFSITQCLPFASDSYVRISLRNDDPTMPTYDLFADQVVVDTSGVETKIRSVWLPPDAAIRSARTITDGNGTLVGMLLVPYGATQHRLYLTTHASGEWIPFGDTNGIRIDELSTVDLSSPGRLIEVTRSGSVTIKDLASGVKVDYLSVESSIAKVVDSTTVVTSTSVYSKKNQYWESGASYAGRGYGVCIAPISPSYSAVLYNTAADAGYIISHAAKAAVQSLGRSFDSVTCAVYSHRHRGLFIGYATGIVAYMPIPPWYDTMTSISSNEPDRQSMTIISVSIYTVNGEYIGGRETDEVLSATDRLFEGVASGVYIIAYLHTDGRVHTDVVSHRR